MRIKGKADSHSCSSLSIAKLAMYSWSRQPAVIYNGVDYNRPHAGWLLVYIYQKQNILALLFSHLNKLFSPYKKINIIEYLFY